MNKIDRLKTASGSLAFGFLVGSVILSLPVGDEGTMPARWAVALAAVVASIGAGVVWFATGRETP